MNRTILVALGTGAVITSAAAIGINAAIGTAPAAVSRTQYDATLARIRAERPVALAQCASLAAAARELCEAQANAHELVQVADLERSFRRTPDAAREAQRARIDARYQVARARCAAARGFERDQCLISAHAARGRALLESHAPYEIVASRGRL